jgi:hypothetical protein
MSIMSEVYPYPTLTALSLRSRSEASLATTFCLLFKLAPIEGRVLARLVTRDHCTKNYLRTNTGHASLNSLIVNICALRKKMKLHNVEITTRYRRGYGVDAKSRNEICKLLAEYDAGVALTRPPSKPKTKLDLELNA